MYKQRYADTDRSHRDENMKLTLEYKRITEQFKDLQSKFRHFELVDTKKYREVGWWGGALASCVSARGVHACARTRASLSSCSCLGGKGRTVRGQGAAAWRDRACR